MSPKVIRRLGLLLMVASAFAAPLDGVRVDPIGAASDVLFILSAVMAGLGVLSSRRRPDLRPYARLMLAVAAFAAFGLLGTLSSTQVAVSLVNALRFTTTVIGLALAFAALSPTVIDVRRFAWGYVLGNALSSVWSYTGVNPYSGRSSGLAFHPNVLGMSAAFGVCLLIGLWDDAGHVARRVSPVIGVVLLAGISRSGSRAAIIALVVGVGVALVAARRYRALIFVGAAGVLVLVALLSGTYVAGENTALGRTSESSATARASDIARSVAATEALGRIESHPISGSGFADATAAHNLYLEVIDVGGVLGVPAYGVMMWMILRSGLRGRRDRLVAGALAAYVGWVASSAFANALWDRWLWFPIMIGLCARATSPVLSHAVTIAELAPARAESGVH